MPALWNFPCMPSAPWIERRLPGMVHSGPWILPILVQCLRKLGRSYMILKLNLYHRVWMITFKLFLWSFHCKTGINADSGFVSTMLCVFLQSMIKAKFWAWGVLLSLILHVMVAADKFTDIQLCSKSDLFLWNQLNYSNNSLVSYRGIYLH